MKGKYRLYSLCVGSVSLCCIAAKQVDVYGVQSRVAQEILASYGAKIVRLEHDRFQLATKRQDNQRMVQKIEKLSREIEQRYHLPNLKIETVYYYDRRALYTTLNICKRIDSQLKNHDYPKQKHQDIIDRMHDFILNAADFLIQHPEYGTALNCKDFHCITPELPIFQKDLSYFREEVPKHFDFIKMVMFSDPIFERRRAAIFLLSYIRSPSEVAKLLTKLLDDESHYIRHDALRVYGELFIKYPTVDVPIYKVMTSLYSCYVAERNKALILLAEVAKSPQYQTIIVKHAGQQILRLLKLSQPNNHLFAYRVLRNMSHKNYAEHDVNKWSSWLNSADSKMKH